MEETHSVRIKNGLILPWKDSTNMGGVLDKTNRYIEASQYNGDWLKLGNQYDLGSDIIVEKHEKCIYLGFFIEHWGHYLIDCLGRAWYLNNQKYKDYRVVFLSKDSDKITGNYLRLLELLGVNQEQICIVKRPTRFDEVVIPCMATDSEYNFDNSWVEMWNRIVANAIITKVPLKVYLSRQKFGTAKNKEFGEQDIEMQFVSNGYDVMYPELLSLDEQISIFSTCDSVACINGTIPLNVLFKGSNALELIVINKTSLPHNNLKMACRAVNIMPKYIDAFFEPFKGIPSNLGEGPYWMISDGDLKSFLEKNGMQYFEINSSKGKTYFKYTLLCLKAEGRKILRMMIKHMPLKKQVKKLIRWH